MKTKNILGLVAIVAVAVAMAFNVSIISKANNSYNLGLYLSNIESYAQKENDNTSSLKSYGKERTYSVECTKTTSSTTNYSGQTTNFFSGGLGGSATIPNLPWANFNANIGGGTQNQTTYSGTEKTTTVTKIEAQAIACVGLQKSNCVAWDPCK